MNKWIYLIILSLIMVTPLSKAATVHGEVYDLNFNKLSNSIVEVNSIPKQSFIVKDQGYSFNLNPGTYIIRSYYIRSHELIALTEERLVIKDQNGNYNLDLILFPYVDNNLTDLNISILDYSTTEKNQSNVSPVLIVILSLMSLMVVAYLIIGYRKVSKKSVEVIKNLETIEKETVVNNQDIEELKDPHLDNAYSIINEEKRINQKELRKRLSLSETKVSLIITQLESEGKVKKIKKGRGNVIILTSDK